MFTYRNLWSPVGDMIGGAQGDMVCFLEWHSRGGTPKIIEHAEKFFGQGSDGNNATLDRLQQQICTYFDGQGLPTLGALLAAYSEPTQAILARVMAVPAGQTTTYKAIGAETGYSPATVSRAISRCQTQIIVPTHRVLSTDGKLKSYPGGLWRKRYLLELEQKAYAQSEGVAL